MKNFALPMLMVLASSHVLAEPTVQSLRGETGVMELGAAPPPERKAITAKPAPRDFQKQPPTIPHNVQGLLIQTRVNMCLACHARNTEKRSQSAKLPDSHFLDREGQTSSDTVAPRRWFCTQCHVPQMDAAPLVPNKYQAAKVVAKKK